MRSGKIAFMEVKQRPNLLFHWKRSGERYLFRCQQEVRGHPDQLNDEIQEILRWCRDQRLNPDHYRFSATQRTVSEKLEIFEADGRTGTFVGSTVFHPAVVSVELDLPERLGPMFSMAFSVSDARR
jgi:hypothetical protein